MIKLKEIVKEIDIPDNMRIHMSRRPITTLNSVSPKQEDAWFKPYGLWYGFGNSWIDWVRENNDSWEGNHIYQVIFSETKNVKKINSIPVAMEFTKEYQLTPDDHPLLNWQKVAQRYDGIEMYPYIRKLKWELPWYFTLEVTSGCIWNFSGVNVKEL